MPHTHANGCTNTRAVAIADVISNLKPHTIAVAASDCCTYPVTITSSDACRHRLPAVAVVDVGVEGENRLQYALRWRRSV